MLINIDLNPTDHGEECLKQFLENKQSLPSHSLLNFLDVNVKFKAGTIITYLYVKPIALYQDLDSPSCHLYYCKKGVPHSEALHLNRIRSNHVFFNQRFTKVVHWLHKREYSEKVIMQ